MSIGRSDLNTLNKTYLITMTAVAVLTAIGEVLLVLAALQILPPGVNAISQISLGGIIGIGMALSAPCVIGFVAKLWQYKIQDRDGLQCKQVNISEPTTQSSESGNPIVPLSKELFDPEDFQSQSFKNTKEPVLEGIDVPPQFSWTRIAQYRVSCGSKHDRLMEIEKVLEEGDEKIPKYFGFSDEQMRCLLSEETKALWIEIQNKSHEEKLFSDHSQLFINLQASVEKDILSSSIPFEPWQLDAFNDFKSTNTTLIVRSSSNEDGQVVNAGGNETISGVLPTEQNLTVALAKVLSSYFSMKSFKNRAAFENPFEAPPLCSVLIMEQIVESPNDHLPIISGVMLTNELGWSSLDEDGIIHITASWGFANGSHGKTVCDEWALTDNLDYSTIRRKPYRHIPSSLGKETKIANELALQDIPSLSERQLTRLKRFAKNVESIFGKSMNVEFVIKEEDLYIVQIRPVQSSYLSRDTSYLEPDKIPPTVKIFTGEMIISGSNQVEKLERSQITYAKNLEEAEGLFQPDHSKAVIVYNYESSTTHYAVNFASYHPPIPGLVLPYDKWLEGKNVDDRAPYLLCTQSGSLVEANGSILSIQKGLFLHPARLTLSICAKGPSIQAKSAHPAVVKLQNLLATTSEVLKERLDEIQKILDQIFSDLTTRTVTKKMLSIISDLKEFSNAIMRQMQTAASKNHMTQLAFHAGMLRQLVSQSGKQALNAHSISGLEVATNLPIYIREFIGDHSGNQLICELALFGQNGFDETIQRRWVEFLNTNTQSNLLDRLNRELELQISLGFATSWLSENFSNNVLPTIEILVSKIETDNRMNRDLADITSEIAEISDKLTSNQIHSKQELEELWEHLEKISNDIVAHFLKNGNKHPLIITLIDLWDLSTKAAKTLHVYEEKESERVFKKRNDAFSQFAIAVSKTNLLNYSLEDFIKRDMNDLGSTKNKFSVQHWIIPVSPGALGRIQNEDERLTVLHQNLLQAASNANRNCLPSSLAFAYENFNRKARAERFGDNSQDYISINNQQASVRINIPLNLHSTVVTLTQKKGCDAIEVMVYMRGSDNYRSQHLNIFKIFGEIADIPLMDYHIFQTDLKVVFSVKEKEKIKLLGKAVYTINSSTIRNSGTRNFNILISIFIENSTVLLRKKRLNANDVEIIDKIASYLWNHLERTNQLLEGFSHDEAIECIWDFLEKHKQLDKISNKLLAEIEGREPKSDFGHFKIRALKILPIDVSKKIIWEELTTGYLMWEEIPETMREGFAGQLFYKAPEVAIKYCEEEEYLNCFISLMDKKLDESEIHETHEIRLFTQLAQNYKSEEMPKKWAQELERLRNQHL